MSLSSYPHYKATQANWLGRVPAHWDVLPIKRVARLRSGETIGPDAIHPEGSYPVYGGNGLRGFTSSYTHEGTLVLIGRQGALCGNVNYASGQFWASEHAVVATPLLPIPPIWFGELLRSMNLGQYSTSAAQPGLSVEIISNLAIPVPPPSERPLIAAFLDRETGKIDALVEEQRRLIELLKEKRQAVISHAVTKGRDANVKLKPSGVEWLGEVPEHWEVGKLKWRARVYSGTDIKAEGGEVAEVPLYGANGVIGASTSPSFAVDKILLGRVGSAGAVTLARAPFAVSDNALVIDQDNAIDVRYCRYISLADSFTKDVSTTAQPLLTASLVKDHRWPFPPLLEQNAIANALDDAALAIDALIDTAGKAADLLEERRSALISAAVTGKIDVRDAATVDLRTASAALA